MTDRLSEDQQRTIPLGARIIAVADAIDAIPIALCRASPFPRESCAVRNAFDPELAGSRQSIYLRVSGKFLKKSQFT